MNFIDELKKKLYLRKIQVNAGDPYEKVFFELINSYEDEISGLKEELGHTYQMIAILAKAMNDIVPLTDDQRILNIFLDSMGKVKGKMNERRNQRV